LVFVLLACKTQQFENATATPTACSLFLL
jgi:hypothetical protein